MLEGVEVKPIKRNNDERGFFAEIFRQDWMGEPIVQSNLSVSQPGVIRAWHRHERGQVDYFVVICGVIKIYATDGSTIFSHISTGRDMEIVRIPGKYWHGFRVIGNEDAHLVYFTTKLYDYKNPDEQRKPWDWIEVIE